MGVSIEAVSEEPNMRFRSFNTVISRRYVTALRSFLSEIVSVNSFGGSRQTEKERKRIRAINESGTSPQKGNAPSVTRVRLTASDLIRSRGRFDYRHTYQLHVQ